MNESNSLADHHGYCPYLRRIQPMKFWVSFQTNWVDARMPPCPALDPHIISKYAPMLSPDLRWVIQCIMCRV